MSAHGKNTQIFITKLPRDTTSEQVRKVFKKFGEIRSVNMKGTYGFVVCIVSINREEWTYPDFQRPSRG